MTRSTHHYTAGHITPHMPLRPALHTCPHLSIPVHTYPHLFTPAHPHRCSHHRSHRAGPSAQSAEKRGVGRGALPHGECPVE